MLKNELSGHEKIWGDLKYTLVRERSQSEKASTLHDSNCRTLWKGNTLETVQGSGAAPGCGDGKANGRSTAFSGQWGYAV